MNRKYKLNENFFDLINSEEKAYFLGLMYADGYHDENNKVIRLSLQHSDSDILKQLRNLLYPNSDKPLGIQKKPNYNDLMYLDINSVHISKNLKFWGLEQSKTFTVKFPNFLNNDLLNHFIRGYMDGDGCISHFMLKNKHFKCQLRIIGTLDFCKNTQLIINNNVNSTGSIRKRGNVYELAYTSRKQVILVGDWLYKNSTIHMERKLKKLNEIKNYKDGRFK